VSGEIFYPAPRGHAQLDRAEWDCAPASGEAAHGVPSRAGSTAPAPTSIYGATKLAQEHILRSWCLATGADLSVLRLQNVYGPGQSLTNSYTGIVVLFTRLAAVEVLVMGATLGLAVALSRSAPPVSETDGDPVSGLLGYPVPPPVSVRNYFSAFYPETLWVTVALLMVGLYAAGVVRLRQDWRRHVRRGRQGTPKDLPGVRRIRDGAQRRLGPRHAPRPRVRPQHEVR
jgi:hypothetical protein